jgi:proline-rich protein PRCC
LTGPSNGADEDEEDEEDGGHASGSPALDFFGLGSTVPVASTSNSTASTSKSRINTAPIAPRSSTLPAAMKISAAPTTAAPDLASNYYATLPVPTKIDPYPGFYQKDDGTWEPRRPDEWEIWTKAQGWAEEAEAEEEPAKKEKQYNMPADFSASAADQSIEVRAANLRGTPAQQAAAPSKYSEEEQQRIEQEKNKAKAKKFSHNARSRHQLSTLVADAQMNRAELEDRISHMKANKRTGGQKYGF